MREPRKKPQSPALKELMDSLGEESQDEKDRTALEAKECPSRIKKLEALHCSIDSAGGMCPVQIEGHVKGQPFYFRSRGESWSLEIGRGAVTGNSDQLEYYTKEQYGKFPDAGFMPLHVAYDFLIQGILEWKPKLAKNLIAVGDV